MLRSRCVNFLESKICDVVEWGEVIFNSFFNIFLLYFVYCIILIFNTFTYLYFFTFNFCVHILIYVLFCSFYTTVQYFLLNCIYYFYCVEFQIIICFFLFKSLVILNYLVVIMDNGWYDRLHDVDRIGQFDSIP